MKAYVIAMDNEAQCIIDNLSDIREELLFGRRTVYGKLNGEEVILVVSGVGISNAAAATQLAISLGADLILNIGVAGGIDVSMEIGDIYEIKSAVQYGFDLVAINGTSIGTLNEYKTPLIDLSPSPEASHIVGSADRFNDSVVDFATLVGLGVTIRDMELGAVAHVSKRAGTPCRAWKCISDVRGKPGDTTSQYAANLKRCLEILTEKIPSLA